MKKLFAAINLLMILAVFIGDAAYIQHGTLKIKAITSILFTSAGAVNLIYAFAARTRKGYPALMLAGLFFAMLGDIALYYDFISGAALFALGHMLYFASFCWLSPLRFRDFLPTAIIFSASAALLLYWKRFHFSSLQIQNVCVAYAFVISLMVGKAVSNFLCKPSLHLAIAAFGSLMFFVSDLMLVLHQFARVSFDADTLCLVLYYPAQCMLGLSMFVYINRTAKD